MDTPRQRVLTAFRHQQPDRTPYQITYTEPARRKLEVHFQSTALDDLIGNHLAKYRARPLDVPLPGQPGFFRDEWGVVWNRTIDENIGVVDDFLLKERSLEGYQFPDPLNPGRYDRLPAFIAANPQRFRYASIGFALFERAWSLRSMTELLVDMLQAPEWVDELFDAITAFDLAVLDQLLRYDLDGILFGDDWGQQTGLIFGRRLWRRFIKPRMAQLYARVRQAGKVVLIHCCGQVQELFPELIEIGLDVFNPFQPDVMDPYAIKKQYGDRLAFYGGVSVQGLLPLGTPAEIRREVRRLMREVGQGGGFVVGPSHDMPGDIPLENLLAFIRVYSQ